MRPTGASHDEHPAPARALEQEHGRGEVRGGEAEVVHLGVSADEEPAELRRRQAAEQPPSIREDHDGEPGGAGELLPRTHPPEHGEVIGAVAIEPAQRAGDLPEQEPPDEPRLVRRTKPAENTGANRICCHITAR